MGPIFLTDNLCLNADSITVPASSVLNTTDAIEYIYDNRPETYITLTDVNDFIFSWTFNADQIIHFISVKNCNAATCAILLKNSVGATIATQITNFSAATDSTVFYLAGGYSAVRTIQVTLSHANYASVNSVILGGIICCTHLISGGTLATDARFLPRLNMAATSNQNWFGALRVTKNRFWFDCDITVDNFVNEAQSDLDFLTGLQLRETPFLIWLNGNRGDGTDSKTNVWQSITDPWRYNNVYRVYDNTAVIDCSHVEHQDDVNNATNGATFNIVEAAFAESV